MYEILTVVAILVLLLGLLTRRTLQACAKANQAEWGRTWLNYLDGLNRLFCKYYHRLEYTPIELPKEGPAIIVANHLSGLDPFLLFATTRRPICFLIAREQYERFGLTWFFRTIGCIPVDRTGRPELALRAAFRALEAGQVIALFPQGKIMLPGEPRKPLKRGGLWLAQHTQCPIYPVHISGICGVGHIFRGIVWRSQARLESFPPLLWTEEGCLEKIQELIEGK